MTKLQLLHRALNERLMAAVEQIMEMVGGTVLEYEEETVRARKENEILRRRLRWMEGENPTDWPDPSVSDETNPTDTLALDSLLIKTEPIDCEFLYGPDTSLTTSVCTADMEMVYPGTSAPAAAGIPEGVVWDSAQSYMAPLDFDPTLSTMARNRSQRRSFACPDCGKVFGREQRLMLHMRVHSNERPYTYRRRKTCFYGDKKRKKKLRGLSKTSREFIEDLSDTSEQTEHSTGSPNVDISASAGPSAPDVEPSEASDEASEKTSISKLSEASAARPVGLKAKQGREKPKTVQCPQCSRAFTSLARLAVHMKTHRNQLTSEYELEDTDQIDDGAQHKVIRNNDTEVEKAKAIGQRLFQCPECNKIFARSCWLSFHLKSHERERKRQMKKQLKNINLKDVPQVTKELTKEVAPESSKVHVLKKIYACPYCDKVFSREGWLGPHIRSHEAKKQKSDIIADAILPNTTKRRSRRVTKEPPPADEQEQKKITEQSLGVTDNSKIDNEQPNSETPVSQNVTMLLTTIPETQIIINNNPENIRDEPESVHKESETITEISTPVPEEASGQKGRVKKRSKKRFPCRECGKVYLLAGWLKTHKKNHKKQRLAEENRRQMMMKEFGKNGGKEGGQNLMETGIREKKQKKRRKTLKLSEGLDDKKKKKKRLTNAMLLKIMENASDAQTGTDKSKMPVVPRGQCICKDCGKAYARKNWLSLHMLGHRKPVIALPQKANDEASKTVEQTTQEGASADVAKGQKGKDGGKASFPCPFCHKVFPRAMRLMVHMQIHSGEKPYSYRQRKEQYYTESPRPKVPDTDKQEPSVESNDEKGKDGGNEVTRSQTSAVLQDHASTTEPMETVQPLSVSADRKFSLLPLQSSGAAAIHTTAVTRTDSKSDSNYSLQPRIVLDPVIAESSHSASSEGGDFKAISMETSDLQLHKMPDLVTSYASSGGRGKSRRHQSTLENLTIPYSSQNMSSESDDPDIVCVEVGSVHKYHENAACAGKVLFSIKNQQTSESPGHRKSEICTMGPIESRECTLLDVKQHNVQCDPEHLEMDIESQQSGSQIHSHGKSRFLGVVKAKNVPSHSEYLKHGVNQASGKKTSDVALKTTPEFVSSAMHQTSYTESGYMILSDDTDDDDDEWASVSNNPNEKKRSNPLPEGLADAYSIPSSSHKTNDSDSDVSFMTEKTGEQNFRDGSLTNRGDTTVQQREKPSSAGQKRWFTCLTCGLMFAAEASLTHHMKVHSGSVGTYQKSNAFKTLKKRVKNNETQIKQQVVQVQTSRVGSAESTDNSGKSDSTLINFSTPKLSGSGSDIGATSRGSRADSKPVGRKSKEEKQTLNCCYCGEACDKLELHLIHDHPNEPMVIEALHCSNTIDERKRLLSLLCSNKKLKHDYGTTNDKDGDLVHCIVCRGYYQRNQFWKHALICEHKQTKGFVLTDPGTSTEHLNTSQKSIHGLAQEAFDPESVNLVLKDVFCNTLQQAIPESANRLSPKAEHHTTRDIYSVSPLSETIPDHGSGSLSNLYHDKSSEGIDLDSESSGQLILDSVHSAMECTSTPVWELCHKEVENRNLACPPCSENDHQPTLQPENMLDNSLQLYPPLLSSSYILDTGSNHQENLQLDTDQDCHSSSVSHTHTGSSDSQPTTNLKSDKTAIPTTIKVNLEQNIPDKMMPELRPERTAQTPSESTIYVVENFLSSSAQSIDNPETESISIQVSGNYEYRAPDVESQCHLEQNNIPKEEQTTDSDTDDTEEGGTYAGQGSDLKPLGFNSTTTVKKRRQQSDQSQQTSAVERKASPVTFQTPQMTSGLQTSDEWNKRKSKLKLTKNQYCLYCRKPSQRMKQHLQSVHAKEPEVAKVLSYDKKSKERKQLLDLLQSKGNLLHKDGGMSKPVNEGLLPVGEACPHNSDRSSASKQENPNPESVSSHVSDTHHSSAQLYTDVESTGSPTEDFGLVGEELFADPETDSDFTPNTSLVRNEHVHKSPKCSSPAYDQHDTSKSEEQKTDTEHSNEHVIADRRRSTRIQPRSVKVKDNASDGAESMSHKSNVHVCQHCNATFCSRFHLRRHEYTHTDERPFWCSQCNVGFIQKYRYRNHRTTHHGENGAASEPSKSKDPSKRCKKKSHSKEKPVKNEQQQQLESSTTVMSEPPSNAEERPDMTERDEGGLMTFHDE